MDDCERAPELAKELADALKKRNELAYELMKVRTELAEVRAELCRVRAQLEATRALPAWLA